MATSAAVTVKENLGAGAATGAATAAGDTLPAAAAAAATSGVDRDAAGCPRRGGNRAMGVRVPALHRLSPIVAVNKRGAEMMAHVCSGRKSFDFKGRTDGLSAYYLAAMQAVRKVANAMQV